MYSSLLNIRRLSVLLRYRKNTEDSSIMAGLKLWQPQSKAKHKNFKKKFWCLQFFFKFKILVILGPWSPRRPNLFSSMIFKVIFMRLLGKLETCCIPIKESNGPFLGLLDLIDGKFHPFCKVQLF